MLLAQMNLASSSPSPALGGGALLLFQLNLQSSGAVTPPATISLNPNLLLRGSGVPFSGDFPKASPGETEPFSIDFAWKLLTGDSIVSASAALTVHYGSDATPGARLSGSAVVTGTVVTQVLSGLLPGVIYNLAFTVTTHSGRVLVNFGRVACVAIS